MFITNYPGFVDEGKITSTSSKMVEYDGIPQIDECCFNTETNETPEAVSLTRIMLPTVPSPPSPWTLRSAKPAHSSIIKE